jgi:peptidoglycan/LPS O-acetylase OafA/YrhL
MTESISTMCDATRTTLFVGSVAAVAAVLATAAYPFQPVEALRWAARISILIAVVVGLRVISGIERDEILSRIAGTDPGKLTPSWSLAFRLVGYVLVPLATLAATHLPDQGQLGDLLGAVSSSPAP